MNVYKLNKARDVDTDEPGVYILNLPRGFRFDEHSTPDDRQHVMGFDSMRELRDAVKNMVILCDCKYCI
jgi:23S rRNA G2445 N2-methylase RlmL